MIHKEMIFLLRNQILRNKIREMNLEKDRLEEAIRRLIWVVIISNPKNSEKRFNEWIDHLEWLMKINEEEFYKVMEKV